LLPFFDQFLVHELVHLFCEQVELREAPLWVVELFCNLGMVGYLVECEPASLPLLRAAVEASAQLPVSDLAVTALDRMEEAFEAGPLDFGWYIMRLTALADRLWSAAGPAVYPAMYDMLRRLGGPLGVADVEALSPAVAPLLGEWPQV
jgi:hypothetical protein